MKDSLKFEPGLLYPTPIFFILSNRVVSVLKLCYKI